MVFLLITAKYQGCSCIRITLLQSPCQSLVNAGSAGAFMYIRYLSGNALPDASREAAQERRSEPLVGICIIKSPGMGERYIYQPLSPLPGIPLLFFFRGSLRSPPWLLSDRPRRGLRLFVPLPTETSREVSANIVDLWREMREIEYYINADKMRILNKYVEDGRSSEPV
jgi:hypothetical protein